MQNRHRLRVLAHRRDFDQAREIVDEGAIIEIGVGGARALARGSACSFIGWLRPFQYGDAGDGFLDPVHTAASGTEAGPSTRRAPDSPRSCVANS